MGRPILCLDFDGVLHSYTSGWQGARCIPDPPVPGAMAFLVRAVYGFEVHVFSTRSHQWGGRRAMKRWTRRHLFEHCGSDQVLADDVFSELRFPARKPPAMVSIDDRALTFTGEWPRMDDLHAFKPWNKRR